MKQILSIVIIVFMIGLSLLGLNVGNGGLLGNVETNAAPITNLNSPLSITISNGSKYRTTGTNLLKDGINDAVYLGFKKVKFSITPDDCMKYSTTTIYQNTSYCTFWPNLTMKKAAETTMFNDSLNTITDGAIISAVPFNVANTVNQYNITDTGIPGAKFTATYNEYLEFFTHLLTKFTGQNKQIIVESSVDMDSWSINNNPNTQILPTTNTISNILTYFNTVQSALTAAKTAFGSSGSFTLYHGCEFSYGLKAQKGFSTLVNDVLPSADCDLFGYNSLEASSLAGTSYSSYLALLQFLKTKAKNSVAFGNNNVYLSRLGSAETTNGTTLSKTIVQNSINAANAESFPLINFEQLYDSKCTVFNPTNAQCEGFWLRKADGSMSDIYKDIFLTNFSSTPSLTIPNQGAITAIVSPLHAMPGMNIRFAVTIQNNGVHAWTTAGNFAVANVNNLTNPAAWFNRLYLASTDYILPGESGTFTFTGTAPSTLGNYNQQYRVLNELTGVFGTASTNQVLKMQAGTLPTGGSTLNHVLVTGQSLSEGEAATPSLSTTARNGSYTLSGDNQDEPSIISLIEGQVSLTNTESPASGIADTLRTLTAGSNTIVTRHGVGATAYSGLKFGTTPFTNGLRQVTNAKAAAERAGYTYKVNSITVVHGESDQIAGPSVSSQYANNLLEWYTDYNREIRKITGQTEEIKMFMDQFSAYNTATIVGLGVGDPAVTLQQLRAHELNPTKIILATPKYIFDYAGDQIHLTNSSSKLLGDYHAKAINQTQVTGRSFSPLRPIDIYSDGAQTIFIRVLNQSGTNLAVDTTRVAARTMNGFRFTDSTNSASVASASVFGNDLIVVTLNAVPTGLNPKLRYGLEYTGTVGGGRTLSNAPGGNIRNSVTTVGSAGIALQDWLVQFEKDVSMKNIVRFNIFSNAENPLLVAKIDYLQRNDEEYFKNLNA